jgi:hypothetical protein
LILGLSKTLILIPSVHYSTLDVHGFLAHFQKKKFDGIKIAPPPGNYHAGQGRPSQFLSLGRIYFGTTARTTKSTTYKSNH